MPARDRSRLTLHEVSFPCGYAPRAIHLAHDRGSLFVGGKDGSIHGITGLMGGTVKAALRLVQVCGKSPSGVRSLTEWEPGWLWVARRGGEMEIVDVRGLLAREGTAASAHPFVPDGKPEARDPVRTVGWVDAQRRFVSFQGRGGTWILPHHPLNGGDPAAALERSYAGRFELRSQSLPLSQVLFIVPLDGPAERRFVLGNRGGEIFAWSGDRNDEAERVDPWQEGEEPAFINHIAVLWNDRQREDLRQARGIFIATDRGVYLICRCGPGLCRVGLDLPGLGAVCMAITYSEAESAGDLCYLWAADSRGDSHLYWGHPSPDPAQMNFRASGISHAGSQSMLAVSWCCQESDSFMVGQARRNNQIVLTEFREVREASDDSDDSVGAIRWLLSRGRKQEIRSFWQNQADGAKHKIGNWPPEAQLSELFEMLAEETATLRPLLEFLGDPTARVAWEILAEIPPAEDAEKRACEAIELWTLSLLGIINRTGGDLNDVQREAAYLGIIRWLLDLRQHAVGAAAGEYPRRKAPEAVLHELEMSIGMIRKWGLFGDANSLRQNLTLPISILREQGTAEQSLDRLTYEVLLFERGLDLRAENRSGNLPGRNAWDIAGLELEGHRFFAVSWHWGGVELFGLRQDQDGEIDLEIQGGVAPAGLDSRSSFPFQVLSGDKVAARDPQQIQRSQSGHSRAVLLARLSTQEGVEKGFLLTAPALPPGSEEREGFHLWELAVRDGRIEPRSSRPYDLLLPAKESVYSLLDLGGGAGIAGLRSDGGNASCLFFQVSESRGSLVLRYRPYKNQSTRGMGPEELAQRSRNRVWSLASFAVTAAEREEKIAHRVVLGCENGEILLLTLHRQDGSEELRGEWELVARMSSPIKALACRRVAELSALRIIAGGADGSVVAWQEVPGGRGDAENDPAKSRRFASLWAFYEGEEISGLHLVDIPEADGFTPMVLAIARDERCFLYNDRHAIADSPLGKHPRRIPVPGSRYGHFQRSRREPPSAFASYLLPVLPAAASRQDHGTGRVAALITASKHGVVRLLSVHYPHFHPDRKARFDEILTHWWATVKGNHQLRLVHAVYRSAPSIELILVRWLLDPRWPEIGKTPDDITVQPWMLPRNLRPVLELREALNADDEEGVDKSLRAALREAFRLEDLHLFEEICEMVLRRGNFDLFNLADLPGHNRRGPAATIYLKILDAIEQSIPQWQGSKDRQESLARITVAKNLVDGDTFLRVIEAASQEMEEARQAAPGILPMPFKRVLYRRIRGMGELIAKRDPRVSLEALRAANLSLQRLCKRLEERRRDGDPAAQIVWKGLLERYFEDLTSAAARVFRSPLELNDAMAHGFARTFALSVCACPSAAMRIATRMTETQLIADLDSQDDLSRLVPFQFQMLEQLGTPVPKFAQELFRIASRPPEIEPLRLPRWKGLNPIGDDWLWKETWETFGYENQRDLACLTELYGLVGWFSELEELLSNRPEGLGAAWGTLEERLDGILDQDTKTLYKHSVEFWLLAVQEFAERILERRSADPRAVSEASCRASLQDLAAKLNGGATDQATIQPRTVLLSRRIAAWSTDMMEELRNRYDQSRIFQPEYTIFLRLFDRLRRSADAFPNSAAVKMSLVQGVLGHHLLEDLDEHILELQEIAHVLDPHLVRGSRRGIPRDRETSAPVAQSFATYLMARSARAESLPKNLRMLSALLDQTKAPDWNLTLSKLLAPFDPSWCIDLDAQGAIKLEQDEFYLIRLLLDELDNNDRKHNSSDRSEVRVTSRIESGSKPILVLDFGFSVLPEEVEELQRLETAGVFPVTPPRYNLARLWMLRKNDLQGPIEPRPDREVASSGMGLYMASFTAAIVGWELKLDSVHGDAPHGHCVFHLTRHRTRSVRRGGKG